MGLLSTIGAASARAYGFTRSAVAAVKDTYFNLTTLLLNTSSTNGAQNNTFIDSSSNNFTITRNGNTTQGTFTPFSQTGWSNYFDGTGYLTLPSVSTTFGTFSSTSTFTIECWIFQTQRQSGAEPVLFGDMAATGGTNYFAFGPNNSGYLTLYWYSGGSATSTTTQIPLNTWTHIACTVSSGAIKLFVNGTLQTLSGVSSFTAPSGSTGNLAIGRWSSGGSANGFFGYLSNLRVTNTALYSTTFTPSTSQLTAVSGTTLLAAQSNRFIDNSTNNQTFTAGNTVSVQAFSPFAPTAAYSTSAVGGSGYFDGSGDYLNFTGSLAINGQFSAECWFYRTGSGGAQQTLFAFNSTNTSYASLRLDTDQANVDRNLSLDLSTTGTSWTSVTNVNNIYWRNNWNHAVVTRDASNVVRMFLNGVLINTPSTVSGALYSSSTTHAIACNNLPGAATNAFTGFIGDLRLVNGSIPTSYQTSSTTAGTAIFTPPTAPLTTTSQGATSGNVALLLNYTNAGIYDVTAKNVLETVGNAQVSTTQAKFGTTSMYFDGAGDYLQVTSNSLFDLKTSDFTVEFWIYPTSFSVATYPLYSQFNRSTTNAFAIEIGTSGAVNVYVTNSGGAAWSIINAGNIGTLTLNTWNHVAFVRNGSAFRGYVNGTQGSLSTNSSNTIEAFNGFNIGAVGAGSSGYFTGYIDEYRITRYARYTSSFTPATTAFPVQ